MTRTALLVAVLASGLLAAGMVAAGADGASSPQPVQAVPPGTSVAQAGKPSVSTRTPLHPGQERSAQAARPESRPTWTELSPQQQQALAPLAGSWRSLGEAHKRKWLALSQNYHTMPAGEQARLHSRMAEWAALSPQQRTLARLNFAESQKVKTEDKRAKWEAYQALPPEEKRKLAARAVAKPPPTAIAVQPVSPQKLARIPRSKKPDNAARIAVVPGQVDSNTLLPQPLAPVLP